MFGRGSGQTERAEEATVSPAVEGTEQESAGSSEATVQVWEINPNAGPAVVRTEDEDSLIVFGDAFGDVAEVERGEPIPDPLAQLSPDEQAEYRDELEDVIKAQRYGQSFGSISRR